MDYYTFNDIKIRLSRVEGAQILRKRNENYIPEIKNDKINIESNGEEFSYSITITMFSGKEYIIIDTKENINEILENIS